MLHRKTHIILATVLGTIAVGSTGGCPSADTCVVGSDCPSGACQADGTCAPIDDGSSSGPDGSTTELDEGTGTGEATVDEESGSGEGSGGLTCLPPNADGLVERDEVPLEAGLSATFLVTQDVAFDSAGTPSGDGQQWNFDVALTGDHQSIAETQALDGRWFEPLFPGATYAARLTDADDLLGVFEATDTALLLRGVVSPSDGLDRTELSYDPPATVLAFPLWEGQRWGTESTVSGLAQGVAAFYTEQYAGQVDASGTAITPFGDFPVLRANVLLTRTVGVVPTTLRTQSFIAECFGTVASLRSEAGASDPEFGQAAEIRRLAR